MSRKTLLVGINTYPGAELAGCVPDIAASCDLLPGPVLSEAGRGIDWESLDACTDDRAHAEGLRSRLARLTMGVKPGDLLLVWFSGHGAQIATRDSYGEVDGMLETLCPYDFNYDDQDTWITDADLLEMFGSLPAGVACTIVLDSCFSGGMPESARALKAPGANKPRLYPSSDRLDFYVRLRAAGIRGFTTRSVARKIVDKVAIVSASLERQTAADAYIAGNPRGAFSYFFWEAILEDTKKSLRETVAITAKKLKDNGFDQIPGVSGPAAMLDVPFLAAP